MVRYYGYYSNASRGKRKKLGMDDGETPVVTCCWEEDTDYRKKCRANWARLIKKIYEVDPLICPKCAGEMRVVAMDSIFKPPLFYDRSYISGPRELSIGFLFDKKPIIVPVGSAGEQSGGARNVPDRTARSHSERAAPSACVGGERGTLLTNWTNSHLFSDPLGSSVHSRSFL